MSSGNTRTDFLKRWKASSPSERLKKRVSSYIKAGRVEEARRALEMSRVAESTIWLKKFNKRYPPQRHSSFWQRHKLKVLAVSVAVLVVFVVAFMVVDNIRVSNNVNNFIAEREAAQEWCRDFGYTGAELLECIERRSG